MGCSFLFTLAAALLLLGMDYTYAFVTTVPGSVVSFNESSSLQSSCTTRVPDTKYSTVLFTKVDTGGRALTSQQLESMASSFSTSFDSIFESNTAVCDPYFRQITSVTTFTEDSDEVSSSVFDFETSDPNHVVVGLNVIGQCQGCGDRASLFQEGQAPLPLDEVPTTPALGGCQCPAGTIKRLASLDKFITVYADNLLVSALSPVSLISMEQVKLVRCGNQETTFTKRVIVEFLQVSLECGTILSEETKQLLGDHYVSSFNSLADKYCDPYFRSIQSATIVEQGAVSADGKLGVAIEVTGTLRCLEGDTTCDIQEISLYDNPTLSIEIISNRRQLQDTSCMCPVNAIAERGVFEKEVIEAFQAQVSDNVAEFSNDCQGLVVADCEFGTIFMSTLQLKFSSTQAALDSLAQIQIETAALETLNDIFSPGDPETCNLDFRIFKKVELVVVQDETRRGLTYDEQPLDFRRLQNPTTNHTETPNATLAPVSSFPTASPTVASGRGTLQPTLPITIFLFASGICSGCTNELFFGNILNDRKLTKRFDAATRNRELQDDRPEVTTSNCFCGLDATVFVPLPKIEEFETGLEQKIELEITETVQVPNEDVYSYPCTNVGSQFQKNITLELQYTCIDAIPDFTDDLKDQIGLAFVQTYNGMKTTVCDPFDQTVLLAEVVNIGDLRADGRSIPLELQVTVECFGCDEALVNLYGFPEIFSDDGGFASSGDQRARERLLSFDRVNSQNRRMQDQTCECDATLPRRAPLEADVTDALDPVLQSLALPCIGNTTQCDFGATFVTNVLLEVELDDTLDAETTAQLLRTAYTNALGDLITGGNETQCNSLFGYVTDSQFFLNFVYNSLERGSNETEDVLEERRNLQTQVLLNASEVPSSAPTFIGETPSSAPTFAPQPSTAFILLYATGVCNGCSSEMFLGNQVSDGRKMLQSSPNKEYTPPIDVLRILQNQTAEDAEGPESECYCPIGATDVVPEFDATTFTAKIQEEVQKVSATTQFAETTYGVSQVQCVEETPFSTTIQFEFSAFRWVVDNEADVQGFGNEIANVYNKLVVEFCDEFFRNSISLTYIPGSLQPVGTPQQRARNRNLQQQGCFNYIAEFSVNGRCRGCDSLGPSIPFFGASSINNRERRLAGSFSNSDDEAMKPRRSTGRSKRSPLVNTAEKPQRSRLLQETKTCICDAGALAQMSAPSLAAVQAELETVIPTTLPWMQYSSICGLPVENEVPCSTVPNGPLETFQMSFFVQRADGQCLTAADLTKLAADFLEIYNVQKQTDLFPCEPEYIQISNIGFDETVANDCLRRRQMELQNGGALRGGGRQLMRDSEKVVFTVSANRPPLATVTTLDQIHSDTSWLMSAIEVRNQQAYTLLMEASQSPSAMPSSEPSVTPSSSPMPSSFPSEFPTSGNCFEEAFQIEVLIEDDQFGEGLFVIPDELDACGANENEGVVFEWDDVNQGDVFVSVEFDGEVTGEAFFVVYEFANPGVCENWDCNGANDNIVCIDGCCTEMERNGKLPNLGVVGYNTEEQAVRVVLSQEKTPCFPAAEIQAITESAQTFPTIASSANTCGLGVLNEGLKGAFFWNGSTEGRIVVAPVSGVCESVQLWQVPSSDDSYCFEWELLEALTQTLDGPTLLFDLSLYSNNPGFFMVMMSSSVECQSSIYFAIPTPEPSSQPSLTPSSLPSSQPSLNPTSLPSSQPSLTPTSLPSSEPSLTPTSLPSSEPSLTPTSLPSRFPTSEPSSQPSAVPSSEPTTPLPSAIPSSEPTECGRSRSNYVSSPEIALPDLVGYSLMSWYFVVAISGALWVEECEYLCRCDPGCNSWMVRNSGNTCYLSVATQLTQVSGCCADHHPHTFYEPA